MKLDLSTCVVGQKLKTKHGTILTYIGPINKDSFLAKNYDHFIEYPNGSTGTRTNDGFTYRNPASRLEADEDIVEIIPLKPKKRLTLGKKSVS
jgi:hypothetical protein